MTLHETLPHWFILAIAVVVGWFVFKSLIKIAIIVGVIGLVVYLWWAGWFEKVTDAFLHVSTAALG